MQAHWNSNRTRFVLPPIREDRESGTSADITGGTPAGSAQSMPEFDLPTPGNASAACFSGPPAQDSQLSRLTEELDPGNLDGRLPVPEDTLQSLPGRLPRMSQQERQASLLLLAAHVGTMASEQQAPAWDLLAEQARRHTSPAFCTRVEGCTRRWKSAGRTDLMGNIR